MLRGRHGRRPGARSGAGGLVNGRCGARHGVWRRRERSPARGMCRRRVAALLHSSFLGLSLLLLAAFDRAAALRGEAGVGRKLRSACHTRPGKQRKRERERESLCFFLRPTAKKLAATVAAAALSRSLFLSFFPFPNASFLSPAPPTHIHTRIKLFLFRSHVNTQGPCLSRVVEKQKQQRCSQREKSESDLHSSPSLDGEKQKSMATLLSFFASLSLFLRPVRLFLSFASHSPGIRGGRAKRRKREK